MNRPGASRPDWLSKLVLPIAVAVLGAILVTALTPLGDNLREVLFPTKADVTGSVSVDGRRAAGARLMLDDEPVGSADDEGTFVIRDVGDGDHTLEIKAVSSKLKRQPFTIEQGASSHALGDLARLGYDPVIGSSFEGITYDVTLWVIAECSCGSVGSFRSRVGAAGESRNASADEGTSQAASFEPPWVRRGLGRP